MNHNIIIDSAIKTIKQEILGLEDLLQFFQNDIEKNNFTKAVAQLPPPMTAIFCGVSIWQR